jgi:dipeptidyl-peptidase-4
MTTFIPNVTWALPQENMQDYQKGAGAYLCQKSKGNLLLVHGTGDDNVHYQNARKPDQ